MASFPEVSFRYFVDFFTEWIRSVFEDALRTRYRIGACEQKFNCHSGNTIGDIVTTVVVTCRELGICRVSFDTSVGQWCRAFESMFMDRKSGSSANCIKRSQCKRPCTRNNSAGDK